jgi:hypothetical protein
VLFNIALRGGVCLAWQGVRLLGDTDRITNSNWGLCLPLQGCELTAFFLLTVVKIETCKKDVRAHLCTMKVWYWIKLLFNICMHFVKMRIETV